MQQIIECVPNFSEGRRPAVVEEIVAAISSVAGVTLLDRQMDADHNRSVVTFVGDAAAVEEAAYRGCARAAALIDLDQQRGAHPRIGATDVIPFIPIRDAGTSDCVALARRLGERVGRELGIPVYLYADAATRDANRELAAVRRGEYEGLKRAIESDPARLPDFGPRRLGTAGAVAIGVRFPLIAFNVNLATQDLAVARAIAQAVRASSGGLAFVKALGLALPSRGLVQVSMNLTDYTRTSPLRAFEAVQREAASHGVSILDSELVGLVPAAALSDAMGSAAEPAPLRPGEGPPIRPLESDAASFLPDQADLAAAARRLRLPALSRDQVLELRLADALQRSGQPAPSSVGLQSIAAAPPGGDSQASRVLPPTGDYMTARALPPIGDYMTAPAAPPRGDSTTAPAAPPHSDPAPTAGPSASHSQSAANAPPAAEDFLAALAGATAAPAGGSAAAYAGAMAASLVMMVAGLTLSKPSYAAVHAAMRSIHAEAAGLQASLSAAVAEDARAYAAVMTAYQLPKSSPERPPAIQRAMRGATAAALDVAAHAVRVLALARRVRTEGLKTARSDSTVAAYLAEASARGALLNARENVAALTDDSEVRGCLAQIKAIAEELADAS